MPEPVKAGHTRVQAKQSKTESKESYQRLGHQRTLEAIHPTEVGEAYIHVISQAQGVFLPEEASPEERVYLKATVLAAFCAKISS